MTLVLSTEETMSDNIYTNRYIPKCVKIHLTWCNRDRLLKYIDQLKYSNFIEDLDKHIKRSEIVNFDFIYRKCGKYKQQQNSVKYYQAIRIRKGRKGPSLHV